MKRFFCVIFLTICSLLCATTHAQVIEMFPEQTKILPGDELVVNISITNPTEKIHTLLFGTNITLPNGSIYPSSGYLSGPIEITFQPLETKTGQLIHNIPETAPVGVYTYHAYIGKQGKGVLYSNEFSFEVRENRAPTSNAGEDQTVEEGILVTLDGSNSYDIDGDEIGFEWKQVSGTSVTLSDSTAVSPTFVSPNVWYEEPLVFELTVIDIFGATDKDDCIVTVTNVVTTIRFNLEGEFVCGVPPHDNCLTRVIFRDVEIEFSSSDGITYTVVGDVDIRSTSTSPQKDYYVRIEGDGIALGLGYYEIFVLKDIAWPGTQLDYGPDCKNGMYWDWQFCQEMEWQNWISPRIQSTGDIVRTDMVIRQEGTQCPTKFNGQWTIVFDPQI